VVIVDLIGDSIPFTSSLYELGGEVPAFAMHVVSKSFRVFDRAIPDLLLLTCE
jgi:hypothetical protein